MDRCHMPLLTHKSVYFFCVQRCNTFIVCALVSLQEEEYYYEELYIDPQPLNCSTTESIKGGNVTYSQVKKKYIYIYNNMLYIRAEIITFK